ncbi:hypothetical protein PSTG_01203 [Puccinia striiformis f. sp. tritici PST-78]|uniref:Uncharacterized protein n=1 Tax=Puccinia striiformis f. sp. tritici PST-78 TaxID=1165861 RepID=A0A0L0W2S1_9BASI|nr:hypothetical protein PSTG_01203 [Puccinia striiformis f. sp. tritici PST-78]
MGGDKTKEVTVLPLHVRHHLSQSDSEGTSPVFLSTDMTNSQVTDLPAHSFEGRLVYHFAEILDNPTVDDSHRSALNDMLEHYIERFKKATPVQWSDLNVLPQADLNSETTKMTTSILPPKGRDKSTASDNYKGSNSQGSSPAPAEIGRTNHLQVRMFNREERSTDRHDVNATLLAVGSPREAEGNTTPMAPDCKRPVFPGVPNDPCGTLLSSNPYYPDASGARSSQVDKGLNQSVVNQTIIGLQSSPATIFRDHERQVNNTSRKTIPLPLSGETSVDEVGQTIGTPLPPTHAGSVVDEQPARLIDPAKPLTTPKHRRVSSRDSNSSLLSPGKIDRLCTGTSPRPHQSSQVPLSSPLSSPEPLKRNSEGSHSNVAKPKKSRAALGNPSPLAQKRQQPDNSCRPNLQKKKPQGRPTVKQLAVKSQGTARAKKTLNPAGNSIAPLFGLSKQLSHHGAASGRDGPVEPDKSATRIAAEALFKKLPAGALERLDFWEQSRNKPAEPLKFPKLLANSDSIISQLPQLLGRRYHFPTSTTVGAARTHTIGHSKFHKLTSPSERLIGTFPSDPIIGSAFINREMLTPYHPDFHKVMVHPLYPCLSFTHEPLHQGWSRMIATLADIQFILTSDRLAITLASLDGTAGDSEGALVIVHTYFQDLADSFNVRKTANPVNRNIPKDYFGSNGGMAYVFEYIASALCALMSFRLDDAEKRRKQPFILSKATNEKKTNCLTKGLACLAQLLVIGPGAIFSQPTARDLSPQWKSAMLLEFGAIAVDAQCPVWNPFGNTRLHIIATFSQMGFGRNTKIDWTLLLEIFKEQFSASRLANVMWEDIVLIADRESSGDDTVNWGVIP